jgi:hypothetical protein
MGFFMSSLGLHEFLVGRMGFKTASLYGGGSLSRNVQLNHPKRKGILSSLKE